MIAIRFLALLFLCIHAFAEDTIYLNSTIPFKDETKIQQAILNECKLPQRQADLFEKAAAEFGIKVIGSEQAPKEGKYLKLVIEDAVSSGNAFIGHRKFVSVSGILFENGAEVGNFIATRNSMGGFFGAYKSSCAVLGRCTEAIAKDITAWLSQPAKNSRLGD